MRCTLILSLVMIGCHAAARPSPGATVSASPTVHADIVVARSTYRLDEPIPLTVVAVNDTDEAARIRLDRGGGVFFSYVHVERAGERILPWTMWLQTQSFLDDCTIPPHSRLELESTDLRRGFHLTTPGTYRVGLWALPEGVPPGTPVDIVLTDAPLPPVVQALVKIQPRLPSGWIIGQGFSSDIPWSLEVGRGIAGGLRGIISCTRVGGALPEQRLERSTLEPWGRSADGTIVFTLEALPELSVEWPTIRDDLAPALGLADHQALP